MKRRLLAFAVKWRENAKTLTAYHEATAIADGQEMAESRDYPMRYAHFAAERAAGAAMAAHHRRRWRRWDWLVEHLGGDPDFPGRGINY